MYQAERSVSGTVAGWKSRVDAKVPLGRLDVPARSAIECRAMVRTGGPLSEAATRRLVAGAEVLGRGEF